MMPTGVAVLDFAGIDVARAERGLLPAQRRIFRGFRQEDAGRRYLFSRLLLNRLLQKRLPGASAPSLTGRPAPVFELGKGHFLFTSLSHSGSWAAAAVSEFPIGIDIERMTERRFGELAEYAFSEEEKARFAASGSDARAFYEIWGEKESKVKLARPLRKKIFCSHRELQGSHGIVMMLTVLSGSPINASDSVDIFNRGGLNL